ncbi:MAG: nitrous oxide-stimulated promoter family protein [Candidatus Omnitrophota bacterium]|nr:nitrous oxide-stimulated promoter family protein [Candidatus Omnitrophota bacterium]
MTKEKKTIAIMIKMYCSGHHASEEGLCRECQELLDYAGQRLDRCPFGRKKPACAKCRIHCYSPAMRAKVISIMKYAGPRMILKHPILAVMHGIQGR